jgi:hypothetical protein
MHQSDAEAGGDPPFPKEKQRKTYRELGKGNTNLNILHTASNNMLFAKVLEFISIPKISSIYTYIRR